MQSSRVVQPSGRLLLTPWDRHEGSIASSKLAPGHAISAAQQIPCGLVPYSATLLTHQNAAAPAQATPLQQESPEVRVLDSERITLGPNP